MARIELLVIAPPGHYALRELAPLADVARISISNDQQELLRLAASAEVILFSGIDCKHIDFAEIWRAAKMVRWVQSVSAGVETVLFPELIDSDVPLTNARGIYKRPLAEFAVLGMLFHFKKLRRLVENQRRRAWDSFTVQLAQGRVMGIVGYGEIGRECALLAKGLGLRVFAMRRDPRKSADDPLIERVFDSSELAQMLESIDVLVCAAPLTHETHHMIGAMQLKAMKPTALVINVGRGPVIDEAALVSALVDKQIAGAALDVFEEEPLPETSALWAMENVLISPHCTDRTDNPDWLDLSVQFFVENFKRFAKGAPLENIVDKRAGY